MKNNISKMSSLDIYLSNLSDKEYEEIKHKFSTQKLKVMPLISWDLFTLDYQKRIDEAKKKTELQQVLSFAKQFNWQNNLKQAFSENEYEALIITDKNQNIIWVNEGFTFMTGYSKSFAINKNPRFLQGNNTSLETKKRVKKKIALNKPFKDFIINQRKDKSNYKCEIKIIPLYNEHTTHYIAFEKQVV
ncbi:diguanylate cyclase [Polaribacter reichenbachii]|uniref:Diguanylate cyclase n=1 Tax=Polaribacter reichenbachii TaxID=996801 RepID=A0A1B8U432_9FLAO|nr:PAS domain-containing protein [Polaribacter reichenbachii]APZ47934.1 diguanylate cyclase [Polaribacter reichenbachii]AUC18566.1 diguanylate cyclase [Polaribacter reichenbachii]OBY66636.1 diguanylate cyclase [Polaribacter reichenbachii]